MRKALLIAGGVAAVIATGYSQGRRPGEGQTPEWPAILESACEADDEHVIKIVYSCWAEDTAYNDPLYRAVAARAGSTFGSRTRPMRAGRCWPSARA